jgi:nucleoside-diphosphate-sugar epimerase
MKDYLVTGGSGFIGSALVHRLVSDGHRVRVFDNGSRGDASRLADIANRIDLVTADIRDALAVRRAVEGVTSVIHLAAVNGTENFYKHPEMVLDVGVRGMLNVVDAVRDAGIDELALASSSEVYQDPPRVPTDEDVPLTIPDPHNPRYSYAGSKLISELLVLNAGRSSIQRVLLFRPHNVYGPDMGREHVIPQLTLKLRSLVPDSDGTVRLPIQGDGTETRSFVYIDDLVEGIMCVLAKGTHLGIYNIGTEDEISIESLARRIGTAMGVKVQVVPGPPAVGGTRRRCPDISRARALGYRPRVSLEAGLAHTVQWYSRGLRP